MSIQWLFEFGLLINLKIKVSKIVLNFDTILTKFGQDIGIGPVTLDERDSCYLRFDQNIIALEHSPQQNLLFIFTSFRDLVKLNSEHLFEHILTCNHFGQGSGNGWFSFNPETQEVLLMTKIKSDSLEYDDFLMCLEEFLNSIEQAKTYLKSLDEAKKNVRSLNKHLKNPFA